MLLTISLKTGKAVNIIPSNIIATATASQVHLPSSMAGRCNPHFTSHSLNPCFLIRLFYISFFFVLHSMTVAVSASRAETVTLVWDENKETDLAGYIFYYGAASGDYSFSMDVGNTTQYTIQNLDQGVTYYFAVSAYDEGGNESDLSVELPHTIGVNVQNSNPNKPAEPSGSSTGYTQTTYTFSTFATDPDGDQIEYIYDWGDGTESNLGASNRDYK